MNKMTFTNKIKKNNFIPFFMSLTLNAQIENGTSFWYAGMQNPELQILFYGKILHKIKFLFLMV
jgi:hypothetical protein